MTPTASDPLTVPRVKLSPTRLQRAGIVRPGNSDSMIDEVRDGQRSGSDPEHPDFPALKLRCQTVALRHNQEA